MDLYLKVAAGFIPAQYHSRFQLQMAGNAHPLSSGGGFVIKNPNGSSFRLLYFTAKLESA
jgi:hypothetical protein